MGQAFSGQLKQDLSYTKRLSHETGSLSHSLFLPSLSCFTPDLGTCAILPCLCPFSHMGPTILAMKFPRCYHMGRGLSDITTGFLSRLQELEIVASMLAVSWVGHTDKYHRALVYYYGKHANGKWHHVMHAIQFQA